MKKRNFPQRRGPLPAQAVQERDGIVGFVHLVEEPNERLALDHIGFDDGNRGQQSEQVLGGARLELETGLTAFFAWAGQTDVIPFFSKALVQRCRTVLLTGSLSFPTVNLPLSPLRKLAREMADNGLLDPAVAAAIERVPGVRHRGTRVKNWRMRDQANDLLNAPTREP